jgi:chromosome segregation ATPase
MEHVLQLEARVAKAIDYVNKITDENTLLKTKLDNYQQRIDELEVLIQRFREDQGRIEECILSALERLNRFEDDAQRAIPQPPPVINLPDKLSGEEDASEPDDENAASDSDSFLLSDDDDSEDDNDADDDDDSEDDDDDPLGDDDDDDDSEESELDIF